MLMKQAKIQHGIYLFICMNVCFGFRLFDLKDVKFTKLPEKDFCKNTSIITIVHSAPSHQERRKQIRETWGNTRNNKVAFLLGDSLDPYTETDIEKEHQKYEDIIQGSFVDTYKNLSYKHLLGYKWTHSHCQDIQYILKTDDDVFVDVFQLPKLLTEFGFDEIVEKHPFFMCHINDGATPRKFGKWLVTKEEYPYSYYPVFCSGGAYVTNLLLIESIVQMNYKKFFWVDDVFLTGILPNLAPVKVKYYQWNNYFLHNHASYINDVLETGFNTPELMVIYDVPFSKQGFLFEKSKKMQQQIKLIEEEFKNHRETYLPRELKLKDKNLRRYEL
ncbi:beta-1,3-galactosyltransferase 5 [Lepeophtheirus salmonis]|uniref:beta-1,3-galactosyltransferase 5 n=1 Tax=Lepeophtheirus salmonis TaxID=72036 RepID=UPI001AEAD1DD|nr:beta-1,3-galactosyltransferase 5-like [Lepeophtheirus salmonis]